MTWAWVLLSCQELEVAAAAGPGLRSGLYSATHPSKDSMNFAGEDNKECGWIHLPPMVRVFRDSYGALLGINSLNMGLSWVSKVRLEAILTPGVSHNVERLDCLF